MAEEAFQARFDLQRALHEKGLLKGEIALERVLANLQQNRVVELEKKLVASEVARLMADEATKRAKARAVVEKSMAIY